MIVERKTSGQTVSMAGAGSSIVFHYIADVQPSSGAPVFRATFTEKSKGGFRHPDPGERVPVQLQAKSQKVKLDYSNWDAGKLVLGSKSARKEQFDATAQGAPGSEAAPSGEKGLQDWQLQGRTPEELRERALAQ